jgi:hypothetical protein
MKAVAACLAALLSWPVAAAAGLSTDSVVQCWNGEQDAISVTCNISHTTDGGAGGYCIVSTYLGGWKGARTDWLLEGRVEPFGGSHPIDKKEKGLAYSYAPGAFGCAISPPLGATYTVGDCTMKGAVKTCVVATEVDGSNRYFRATTSTRPYRP